MTDRPAAPPSPWADWPLDREIVMARVVDADRHTAFRAWTDPDLIVQWFGPAGFRIDTREIDIRVGGVWRFDMIRPDGTLFSNRMTFLRIEAPWLIEFVRGTDSDDDPDAFRPDRWAGEKPDRYAYLPFGDGPRICIGASFAIQEAVIILASLLARFRFTAVPGKAPTPTLLITLRPEPGVWLQVARA